jgi:hypothetical protein
MNITNQIKNSLASDAAEKFAKRLNKQESQFRKCLTVANRERAKALKMLVVSNNDYLRDSINVDVLSYYESRPTLMFSTEVKLTKEQKQTLLVLSGWNVYSMVYNLEDECWAVLIKNAGEGNRVQNSTVKVQKWGMIYPDGTIKSSVNMPISRVGSWGKTSKRVQPTDVSLAAISQAQLNKQVANGIKAGRFTIDC